MSVLNSIFIGKEKLRLTEQLHNNAMLIKDLEYQLVSAKDNFNHTRRMINELNNSPERYMDLMNLDAYQFELLQSFITQLNPPAKTVAAFSEIIQKLS